MTITPKEIQALVPILQRESTMIGGDSAFARKLLEKLAKPQEIRGLNDYETKVFNAVANHYGVDPRELLMKGRTSPIPRARIVVSYYLYSHGYSFRQISVVFDMHDRTTVYHYGSKFRDKDIVNAVNDIGKIEP